MGLFAKYRLNPKKCLLIDAFGAGITVLLLTVILEPFQKAFGMPMVALRIFSIIGCIFFIYSLMSYYFGDKKHTFLLKVIAFGNTLYCCLIAFCVFHYFEKLTVLGRIYFLLEIAIILGLVVLELKTASKSAEE